MIDVLPAMLVLIRTAAFLFLLPPWAGRGLPNTVKIGLSLALAVFWCGGAALPTARDVTAAAATSGGLVLLGCREALGGAVLAQIVGLVLAPPRIAGAYLAHELGLTFAAIASPTDAHPTDVVAQVFEMLGLVLFFTLDLHHLVYVVLDASWSLVPCGAPWPAAFWLQAAQRASGVIETGLLIAGVVGVILALVTVWTALAVKLAPQLHLFSWGPSARMLIGLAALTWFLPDILNACARSLMAGVRSLCPI